MKYIALCICSSVMVVLGSWIPPMIEAPEPPRMSRSIGIWYEFE